MDVTDVKTKPTDAAKQPAQATRKAASELSANKVNISRTESVRVEVSERGDRSNKTREQANEVISTLNKVADVANEIDKIVTSLSGLAEQAADGSLPESRRKILEDEAQQLLDALDERSKVQTEKGLKPLQGDPIELEVEETLGETLKVILPETTKEGLWLENLNVSRVDTILATRRSIDEARDRLEELKAAVLKTTSSVQKTLEKADVASQNQEASVTSIRDVDAALDLTGGIKRLVSDNPEAAIQASVLSGSSLRLLQGE